MGRILERGWYKMNYAPRNAARFFFFMIFPVISIVSFLVVYPTIKGFIMSFQNYTVFTFWRVKFVGLKNYVDILTDPDFPQVLLNTLIWIAGSVIFQLILGFILALLLWSPFKGRGIYAGFVFYPWALSGFAIGLVWSWLFNGTFGIVNDILKKLHLISENIHFLSDPNYAMFSVILINIWYGIPFFAIMILAALQSIPKEVIESAMIDGAGYIKRIFSIVIPYIKPTLLSSVLLRIIWIMNFPDIIYGTTRGGPAGSTNILPVYMINIVFYETNFSKASAVGVIIIVILLVYTLFYLKLTSYGEMEF